MFIRLNALINRDIHFYNYVSFLYVFLNLKNMQNTKIIAKIYISI